MGSYWPPHSPAVVTAFVVVAVVVAVAPLAARKWNCSALEPQAAG